MNENLIKKTYEHFNGVWPDNDYFFALTTGSRWSGDVESIGSFNMAKVDSRGFLRTKNKCKSGYLVPYIDENSWVIACTRDEFNKYHSFVVQMDEDGELKMNENIPEGATHKYTYKSGTSFYKKVDAEWHVYNQYRRTWRLSVWKDLHPEGLTPIESKQWLPEVGQECECESGFTESGWELCTFEGSTRIGNVISWARNPLGKLISKEVKFRPLKTEREKFADRCMVKGMPLVDPDTIEKIIGIVYDKGARFNE